MFKIEAIYLKKSDRVIAQPGVRVVTVDTEKRVAYGSKDVVGHIIAGIKDEKQLSCVSRQAQPLFCNLLDQVFEALAAV